MQKVKIHLHFFSTAQTSVFDYEGWAHGHPAYDKEFEFKGNLKEARNWLRSEYSDYLYGISKDINYSYIIVNGRKYPITDSKTKRLQK